MNEFVHVVTDPRRYEPPVGMGRRWPSRGSTSGKSNVLCLALDAAAVAEAFDIVDRHRLGRKRLADTLLAATFFQHGVRQIVTCNRADFEGFPGVEIIDPRAPGTP